MESSILHESAKRVSALESTLASLFEKIPHLPHNIRDVLAKIAPWLALLFGLLGILLLLPLLLFIPMASSVPMMGVTLGWYPFMIISIIAGVVSSVLDLFAFPSLLKRAKKGWNLLFYSILLSVASSVLGIAFGSSGLLSVVGSLVGLWLLFEVRGLYHAHA